MLMTNEPNPAFGMEATHLVRCANSGGEARGIQSTLDTGSMAHEMCPACGGDPGKCSPKFCKVGKK
jgi:hypothetical protein